MLKQAADEKSDDITADSRDEDFSLMLQVSAGSEHALRMLIGKWQKPLINYFYRSSQNLHTAEDLAQQTFVNLYRAKDSYAAHAEENSNSPYKAKFSTYLFHIARNILISEHRRSMRRPADATDPAEMNFPEAPNNSKMSELEEIFYNTLEKLPENQRTAILLLKQQELSYEEIAEVMQSNVQSVKTWIHRSRKVLRDALEASGHNGE